ncbi:transketolase [Humidesulfovibrio mexicanus]|uniref:Transketolase n=1 Tax=Humidesulfovibrio mexicanus TaxID=147047 RepID=A0A239CWE0_9BACT|nr:transketolase [Humidesulfovibrio mexicanus]SNS23673.1 transketolase [Humidesulfovibrio mexicanus]
MAQTIAPDQLVVNTLKGLIMDMTRAANSGHPGGAMSSADFAAVLYSEFLNFDPDRAGWFNRDRFVLSAGHESALLYGLLHMAGFIDETDVAGFRQLGSRTPGHPEHDVTPGVEATTGPLGQGFAMGVGMAQAEAFLRAKLGKAVADHHTYVLASDGDMQEPVVMGAASLAGLWGLGKLVVYYDSNKVQLAGPTSRVDKTDYAKVFSAMGWHVQSVDGHDRDQIRAAIKKAQAQKKKPSLIIGHTVMAKGAATREGDFGTHGEPLSPEEIAATKTGMCLHQGKCYEVPAEAKAHFQARFPELRKRAKAWQGTLARTLKKADPDFLAFWKAMNTGRHELPIAMPAFEPGKKIATRQAWGACLNAMKDFLPNLVGGSADLDPSNQTAKFRDAVGIFGADNPLGRNLSFGVREFPMAAIMNGMALHGGVIPFGATFLTFSDYCRNAIRMSALQKLPVLYIFTHDSFHVGEDGPTHQPIEHVASLRLIPELIDLRPADATETALCLETALRQTAKPSCVFLTRQGLPVMDPKSFPAMAEGVKKGGYVLKDCGGTPELIMLASGSEVSLVLEAAEILEKEAPGRKIRVVSMPSVALFEEQPQEYKDAVLPPACRKRVAVEAGRAEGWYRYVGLDGLALGLGHFGESAPAGKLAEKYGFTAPTVARKVRERFFG